MSFTAIDPSTASVLSEHPFLGGPDVESLVRSGHEAHVAWKSTGWQERVEPLRALAALLRDGSETYGALMTSEMGKPLTQAVAEAEKCAWVCEYYADTAERSLAPVAVETPASRSYYTYRPLGVVLGIMPWNFPFWQALRFAAPTLMAGNAVLLKHAPSVPGCALALESLCTEAGFPPGLFTNLFVDTDATGELIEHDLVRGVSMTGSVRAGRAVAARAGRALKPCVLELGGSDPSVVLADADLELAVAACAVGRLQNTGQSCVAAKRFIVVDEVRERFESMLVDRFRSCRMGDPLDPSMEIGPMARLDLRDQLHDQVERSVRGGAHLALGGEVPDRPGAWYPPTVLTDVRSGMAAYEEELFGPVAAVLPVGDEAEALRVANDTPFGLGASVYTRDVTRGEKIAADVLEAGNCFVNGIVRSDPRLPFGGVKDSGYGRELSPLGIRAFTNVKTVWVT